MDRSRIILRSAIGSAKNARLVARSAVLFAVLVATTAPATVAAEFKRHVAGLPREFAVPSGEALECKRDFSPGGLMAQLQPMERPVWEEGDSRRLVYIAADAHSGSSLLGQLLAWNPEFFYLFEPDNSNSLFDHTEHVINRDSTHFWWKLFACEFANQPREVIKKVFWEKGYTVDEYINNYSAKKAAKSEDYEGKAMYDRCRNRHVATKVISQFKLGSDGRGYGFDRLEPICHFHHEMHHIGGSSTMYHVGLFRDPRAIINAHLKSKWIDRNETQVREWAGFLCQSMWDRYELPRSCIGLRRHTVMYEDMVSHPVKTMEDMYSFLGLPVPCDVREQFAKATGKGQPPKKDDAGLRRLLEFKYGVDAGSRAAAWTTEMEEPLQKAVEDVCGHLLPPGLKDYYGL